MAFVMSQAPSAGFAPGQSPFQVKGTIWIGVRAYVDQHVTGGSGKLAEVIAPDYAAFLQQLFVGVGWYDALPMPTISRAIAVQRAVTPADQVRHTAAWHGEQDLKGTYKVLLKQDTPQAICRRFASIYSQLYNFGRVEVLREDDKRVVSCAHGMPEPLAEWWMAATEAYLQPILAQAGARQPRMIFRTPVPDGESHGTRLLRVTSQTLWS
jgi:hypothetical protein